jgi:homogentisate 1,2-dioxygenase
MQEFVFPIVNNTGPKFPFNQGRDWAPFGAWLNGSMIPHVENDEEYKHWQEKDTSRPGRLQDDGITAGIIETESPLRLTDWAYNQAGKNFKNQVSAVFLE